MFTFFSSKFILLACQSSNILNSWFNQSRSNLQENACKNAELLNNFFLINLFFYFHFSWTFNIRNRKIIAYNWSLFRSVEYLYLEVPVNLNQHRWTVGCSISDVLFAQMFILSFSIASHIVTLLLSINGCFSLLRFILIILWNIRYLCLWSCFMLIVDISSFIYVKHFIFVWWFYMLGIFSSIQF